MFDRISRVIVFFAAVQILGGHWMALQSAGWIGMLADYSRGATLVTAFEKTFDGAHPCELCKVVQSGREQEKKEVTKVVVKLEGVLTAGIGLPWPRTGDRSYPPHTPVNVERRLAPPTPPPRVA